MRSPRAPMLLAALALGATHPRDAGAWCRVTAPLTPPGRCEAGVPVAWPVRCVGLHVNTRDLDAPTGDGQDLGALVRRYAAEAVERWGAVGCGGEGAPLRVVMAGDVDAPLDVALDGRNVISVNRRWAPDAWHRPGTVAFTVMTTDAATGALLEADVELDARAMENPLGWRFGDGATEWGVADAPSVLLHELGHVAGLWHSLEAGAVMEASMDVERRRRELADDDRRGLCALRPRTSTATRPAPGCAPERPSLPAALPMAQGGCSAAVGGPRRGAAWWVLVALAARRLRGGRWRAKARRTT